MTRNKDIPEASALTPDAGRARLIMAVLGLATFITMYDTASMNVAMSRVVTDLHTTLTGVQTAIALFALVMAAFMIPGSKLADMYGKKRAFVAGLILYGAGALVTAISPNLIVMILGWSLLEGIGAALMAPTAMTLVMANFPDDKERTKAFGFVVAMSAVGAAAGPLICGFITTISTWRVSFLMEVVVLAFVLTQARKMHEAPLEGARPKMDLVGVVLSVVGLVALVYGILQAGQYGWVTSRHDFKVGNVILFHQGGVSPVIVLSAIGIVFIVAFLFWEQSRIRRKKDPLVHPAMFKDKVVSAGTLAIMAAMFAEAGTLFVVPVFLQMGLEYNAMMTGLTLLPFTAAIFVVSQFTGKLYAKYTTRALVRVGFLIEFAGIALLSLMMQPWANGWTFIPAMLLIGVGLGLYFAPVTNLAMSAVSQKWQNEYSGVSRSLSNLGSSLGTSVAGALLIAGMISVGLGMVSSSPALPQTTKQAVQKAFEGNVHAISITELKTYLKKVPEAQAKEIERIVWTAQERGMQYALISVGLLGLLGLVATFWLPKEEIAGDEPAAEIALEADAG
ncbi:MAG: MFS transporter [Candidatus Geothermincolia bacterium]